MRALALLVLVGACGNGAPADEPDAGFNCEIDQRDEAFTAGMSKTGDLGITFTLASSDPAPPARNNNVWVVDVADGSGPLVGAAVRVKPWMPDHNHGTSIPAITTEDTTTPGRYTIDPVNLFMPGIWEITLSATPAGGAGTDKDEALFTFCVAN